MSQLHTETKLNLTLKLHLIHLIVTVTHGNVTSCEGQKQEVSLDEARPSTETLLYQARAHTPQYFVATMLPSLSYDSNSNSKLLNNLPFFKDKRKSSNQASVLSFHRAGCPPVLESIRLVCVTHKLYVRAGVPIFQPLCTCFKPNLQCSRGT